LRSKFEDVLKDKVSCEVRLYFESANDGGDFKVVGRLMEVTDDYIHVRFLAGEDVYVNRKTSILIYMEVLGNRSLHITSDKSINPNR